MSLYELFLMLHIVAGAVALLAFWTAALVRKGSPQHRLGGRVHLLAMLAVIVSGAPLAWALLQRGQWVFAVFLAFLLVLVADACWLGWRAIRDRAHPQRYFGPVYWMLGGLVLLGGLGVLVVGVHASEPLLVVFGLVGLAVAVDAVRAPARARAHPAWWVREHYSAMIGNGVASHIAFLGIGLRGMWPGLDAQWLQWLAWFGPLLVAVLASVYLDRRYRKGVPGRSPVAAPAGATRVAGAADAAPAMRPAATR